MKRSISVFVLLLIAALPCAAGIVTSSLTGRVTAGEQTLSGVRITLNSPSLQQPRTTTTSSDGRYFVDALPPGEYQVTFELKGMQTLTRSAVVELGRVARADAQLQPSEDEESVTSTAKTMSVVDTTAITSHFSRDDLDRLPLWAGPHSAREFAPATIADILLDETPLVSQAVGYDVVDQETIMRGALPAGLESSFGGVIAMRTRSGGEDFSLSIRDSYVDTYYRKGHFFETESGGRIVPEKLWFFAGGWSGKDLLFDDADGFLIKLTAQPWASHNVVASYLSSDWSPGYNDHGTSTTIVRYTGVAGQKLTLEALASRASDDIFFGQREDHATARLSYGLGSHVLSGGIANMRLHPAMDKTNITSGFISDRWAWRNLTVDAGLRLDGSDANPRLAATYDLHGDGRQAVVASYGEYDVYFLDDVNVRMTSLGFVTALGNEGTARIDAIRRDNGGRRPTDQLQFDSRYRLFDRFELGAVWSWNDTDSVNTGMSDQIGRVWAGAQLPLGSHELGFTVSEGYADEWGTDVALRYMFPFRRVAFTLGADAIDLFDSARALRFWARVRV